MQRYFCKKCNKSFQSRRRKSKSKISINKLWHEYVWERQTLNQLCEKYGKDHKWIQRQFDKHIVKRNNPLPHLPQPINLLIDFSKLDDDYGALVFRAKNLKINLAWIIEETEQICDYANGVKFLKKKGWTILSLTIDGKPGARELFSDIPVQMCQWHQQQIIFRYITRNPKLDPNIELFHLTLQLCNLKQQQFIKRLNNWKSKWGEFLKEKSFNPATKHWHYTHRRTRSALRSLENNLPYLFVYQQYPELDIPNTTNSLEGTFSQLKLKLRCHRGISGDRKKKIINELLLGQKYQKTTHIAL